MFLLIGICFCFWRFYDGFVKLDLVNLGVSLKLATSITTVSALFTNTYNVIRMMGNHICLHLLLSGYIVFAFESIGCVRVILLIMLDKVNRCNTFNYRNCFSFFFFESFHNRSVKTTCVKIPLASFYITGSLSLFVWMHVWWISPCYITS